MTALNASLAAAIEYFQRCLGAVRLAHMTWPTPCAEWTVRDLLVHLDDSISAFCEGATGGLAYPAAGPPATKLMESIDPVVLVEKLGRRARFLRQLWGDPGRDPAIVDISTVSLPGAVVLGIAGIEFAVHGWDLAQGVELKAELPGHVVAALLPMTPYLLPSGIRDGLFAPPLKPPEGGRAEDALLAILGRVAPSSR